MTIAKATAVYIDGYNLYYGRIRGTAFKWLDVVALFVCSLTCREAYIFCGSVAHAPA